jgi:hypothetical protein
MEKTTYEELSNFYLPSLCCNWVKVVEHEHVKHTTFRILLLMNNLLQFTQYRQKRGHIYC